MSAMKAFMEDEAYAYKAGLEAGIDNDIFALAVALAAIEVDAQAYAVPHTVACLLSEALFQGWDQGQEFFDLALPVDIRISEGIG
ncbi:hypothetical protein OV320_7828 [Actinobacteria bacterium OV320]|nr:hypothetical protein OV320_7828 [Actinobacteria bacterium OV320]